MISRMMYCTWTFVGNWWPAYDGAMATNSFFHNGIVFLNKSASIHEVGSTNQQRRTVNFGMINGIT